jgi:hypothetical protein
LQRRGVCEDTFTFRAPVLYLASRYRIEVHTCDAKRFKRVARYGSWDSLIMRQELMQPTLPQTHPRGRARALLASHRAASRILSFALRRGSFGLHYSFVVMPYGVAAFGRSPDTPRALAR